MIAVGIEEKSAKVYKVHKGYRMFHDENFIDVLMSSRIVDGPIKMSEADIEKKYGPVMTNLYTWRHHEGGKMIAVGNDPLFAKVYAVLDGYRELSRPTLGQLVKFMAVDEDTFEGPKLMLMSDIEKKYGPVRHPGQPPPKREYQESDVAQFLMAAKRAGYTDIGKYRGYRLHEYIRKDMKKPRFIALTDNLMSIPDGTLMTEDNNSVVDLKIKIREMELGSWGAGYLTGYPFLDEKSAEETYMGIRIGRYTERAKATHLPKFGARIIDQDTPNLIVLEGDTVEAVRQEIRDYKKSKK